MANPIIIYRKKKLTANTLSLSPNKDDARKDTLHAELSQIDRLLVEIGQEIKHYERLSRSKGDNRQEEKFKSILRKIRREAGAISQAIRTKIK